MADHQTIEFIQNTISEVLKFADIQAKIDYEDSLAGGLVFNIRSRDAKLLIGRQGSTLYALEHIIHSIVSRQNKEERILFSIDVDDYKRNRQYQIKQMIKEEVAEMKRSGNTVSLPAMPKYERKFVHTYLQEQFPHVTSESVGQEPSRYIKLSL